MASSTKQKPTTTTTVTLPFDLIYRAIELLTTVVVNKRTPTTSTIAGDLPADPGRSELGRKSTNLPQEASSTTSADELSRCTLLFRDIGLSVAPSELPFLFFLQFIIT